VIRWSRLCTPYIGVSLWGENPMYENLREFIIMDTTKSISRRQGRKGNRPSQGRSDSSRSRYDSIPRLASRSRGAKVRARACPRLDPENGNRI
jgi:hypothetical protein